MDPLPIIGEPAPGFELSNQHGEPISLSSLRGSPVVLVFYPFAFSRVCTSELDELQAQVQEFASRDARVLGVSVDHKYTLRAYAEDRGYAFDLLADFWPHGAVAESYGVLDQLKGYARRATFFIDDGGLLRSRIDAPLGQARAFGDYQASLRALTGVRGL